MIINSFKLDNRDVELLEKFMKENNIKNKSLAIRKCIKIASEEKEMEDYFYEQNIKINRMLHNISLTKKLLEQFFVNTGFAENMDVANDNCLKEFYEINNSYKNNFLG